MSEPMTVSRRKTTARTIKRYTPELVRNDPDSIYVFGDNNERRGKGGQAVIRDEANAFGITTKKKPCGTDDAYMSDVEYGDNVRRIDADITRILDTGKPVVFPEDGIGTGLAELATRAPRTFSYLQERLQQEFNLTKRTLPDTYRTSYPIREALQRFHKNGVSVNEMARRLGLDRSTVYYHLRIMGMVCQRPVVKGNHKKGNHKKGRPKKGWPTPPPEVNEMASQWLRRRWQ